MSRVWERFPDTHLIIAGGRTPFTVSFKELAAVIDNSQTHGNGGQRIHFLDNIDELQKQRVIESCDIFASPSGFESFGITILEAWQQSKPVIACDIAVSRCLITHGETGFLVPYREITPLADTIGHLLKDPELRTQVGQKGHEKLKKNFTKAIIGEQYRQFYDKIMHLAANNRH